MFLNFFVFQKYFKKLNFFIFFKSFLYTNIKNNFLKNKIYIILIHFQTKKYSEKQPFSYPQTPSSLNLIIMAANKFVMIGDIVLEIHTYIYTYIHACVWEREREREREREARTTSVYEIEMWKNWILEGTSTSSDGRIVLV